MTCRECGARGPRMPVAVPARIQPLEDQTQLLRTVINESPDIVMLKNWEGQFLLANQTLARLYNTTPEEMVGKSDEDFNPNQEQVDFYRRNVQEIMRLGKPMLVYESSTDAVSGEKRFYQSLKKPLKAPDGSDRILIIAHDITELKKANRLIEEKEQRYAYAMDAADVGLWDWDIETNTVTHNARWCDILGLDDNMHQHPMDQLAPLIFEEDRAAMFQRVNDALNGNGLYRSEHRMVTRHGKFVWIYDRGRVMERNAEGKPTRMLGTISDITARKVMEQKLEHASQALSSTNEKLELLVTERTLALRKANQELQEMATKDPLTGVGNRLRLNMWLKSLPGETSLSIIMIDIDRFKRINDLFGHKQGDKTLQVVASTLDDSIGQKDLLIRWGGEEFLILRPDANHHEAFEFAELVRVQIGSHDMLLPNKENVTLSMGVAACTVADFNIGMSMADKALYQAKKSGRNRTISYI